MKLLWAFTVAALCALVAEAYADTVYLKNGDTVWGREITEEGETVIVVRPSGTLRFPKRDVNRIERERMSIPQHYDPPTVGGAARDEGQIPARPGAPAAVPTSPATPAPAQAPATTTGPAQAPPAVAGPSRLTPTVLPPPSPPAPDRPR
jgi:hypothetical protein